MRGEFERAEQIGEGGIADVEPTAVGAEGRHHQARIVCRKAAPGYGAAALRDTRDWMQMTGDLADRALRQMAEGQGADGQRRFEYAADIGGRLGIVITDEPYPVAPALQSIQVFAVPVRKPRRTATVMETVAERRHAARRIARNQAGEARQRRGGVIGRKQLAPHGEARAFFQMQVGDGEQALLRPIERAIRVGDERYSSNRDGMVRSSPRPAYARIASFGGFEVRRSAEREGRKAGIQCFLALDFRLRGNERGNSLHRLLHQFVRCLGQ